MNDNIIIALISIFGVIIGTFISSGTNYIVEKNKNKKQNKLDNIRQDILMKMLQDKEFEWRKLSTLSKVIGCTEEETKNHLIVIGARGSEKESEMWGLILNHPLERIRKTNNE